MTMGRQRGPRGRGRDRTRDAGDREQDALTETVVNIRRVAKTVAGGRRFSFNALVVVGDGQGHVGFGMGKASEVPDAVQKGSAIARRSMSPVPLVESTVPQQIVSKFGGAQVLLKPASPGTGVRASAAVRAVVQAAGVRDILTKSLGSNNPANVVQATIQGMQMMRKPDDIISLRRMVRGEPPLPPKADSATEPVETENDTAPTEPVATTAPAEVVAVADTTTAEPAADPASSVEPAASLDLPDASAAEPKTEIDVEDVSSDDAELGSDAATSEADKADDQEPVE